MNPYQHERAYFRVQDVKRAIGELRIIFAGKSKEDVESGFILKPAFERKLEIVSEASKNIPQEWKGAHGPHIPWHQIAGIGNILRHEYRHVSFETLWSIYVEHLDPLEHAIDGMLVAYERPWPE